MAKKNVLLVEGNEDIGRIVRFVLEEEGFHVTLTSHLPAQKIAGIKCDLILLDEWFTNEGGHMLCKEIKAIHEMKHVPVIIFSTAVNITELVEECGADGFIRKPFDVEELIKEVTRLMS